RAAELLVRVLESGEPLAVGQLAAYSGLPKSTTSRLVGALERSGLVQRSADRGRLSAGPVLLRFAHRDGGQILVELAEPVLEHLARETRETINLAVPGPLGAEHLSQRDSEHFVAVTHWVGRRVPHRAARAPGRRAGHVARGPARPPRPQGRCSMTHEEIIQGLYDHTLVGNAPEVRDLVNQGLADDLDPEKMLYDGLIPSLEEVGA